MGKRRRKKTTQKQEKESKTKTIPPQISDMYLLKFHQFRIKIAEIVFQIEWQAQKLCANEVR